MKPATLFLLLIALITFLSAASASEPASDADILAQRGEGVITQNAFFARAQKIPADVRGEALRSRSRLQGLLNALLLREQLAAQARAAGFDRDQVVMDRMQLAANAELADAWLQHHVDTQPPADYEVLAHEYYRLHRDEIQSSPKIDVSHILISRKDRAGEERSEEEVKELADSVRAQLEEKPAAFDELVLKYSEDPSAASNKGHFKGVQQGDMVKPFERAAFALKAGEISKPVKTQYGYHIIRLDARIAPEKLAFEEVKEKLMDQERKKHQDRIRREYVAGLTSLDVQMTEEALREMVKRVFGEESGGPQAPSNESG